MCSFVGPLSAAAKGFCTNTAGYISNAEIDNIISIGDNIHTYQDKVSGSDILIYSGMNT